MKVPTKMFRRHTVELAPLFGLANSAWCATTADSTDGVTLETTLLVLCALAAGSLLVLLRKAHAQLRAQSGAAGALQKELEGSRTMLGLSHKRHQAERDRLQAQLQDEIARREAALRLAMQNAQQDALTQLPNRVRLLEDLAKALASAERANTHLAVMFVDIDDFKRINDTLGHSNGDNLLRQAAARLSACVRDEDEVAINRDGSAEMSARASADTDVARVGGDEFVLLFRNVADQDALGAMANRLIEAFHTPFSVGGYKVQTCISVGIACYPRDGQCASTLLKNADMAMYRAKEEGKDGFEFFSHEMGVAASRRLAVENGLRRALERQQFVVYYQPKLEAGSFRVVGVEALVRWRSPEHGLVAPGHFIEIAEQTGLIAHIGEWVLLQACRQQRAWQDAGLPPIQMAVNVSSLQFREDHLLAAVVAALKETGIAPSCLQLEVTENLFMKNMAVARNTLDYVRNLGATVAIDDFGTGYSSFGYLKKLPVDCVKIDRSFVQDLGAEANGPEIIRAIIGLARVLGVKTVAEGVETRQQLDLLTEMGCDEMQGFLFARPVDAEVMGRILQAGKLAPDTLSSIVHFPVPNHVGACGAGAPDGSAFEAYSKETVVIPMWNAA